MLQSLLARARGLSKFEYIFIIVCLTIILIVALILFSSAQPMTQFRNMS